MDVFSHLSKMRRSNAMRHIAPNYSTMLIDPLFFSTHDHRYFFGDKFIDALEKEAAADVKLDKIGRAGGQNFSRGGHNNFQNRKGDGRSGGGANFKSGGGGYNWNSSIPAKGSSTTISSLDPTITSTWILLFPLLIPMLLLPSAVDFLILSQLGAL